MYQYRDYQADLDRRTFEAWSQGARNVLLVSDTGTGKTVITSNIAHKVLQDNPGKYIIVLAHRSELVSQLSCALAENGIEHKAVASKSTCRFIQQRHVKKFKRSYVRTSAHIIVASVDTFINYKFIQPEQVALWVIDEGHHVLRNNKWGKCVAPFSDAKGLGVTATPERGDGCGLGAHADGVYDVMLENQKSMADLILEGRLSRFMIYEPPSDLDVSDVNVTAGGDFNRKKLATATRKSHIMGDAVEHYKAKAMGKLGVTFVPDVEIGEMVTANFNANGVPAKLITAKTGDAERANALDMLENRRLLQLVNVDIFGEGFDLPAIECVSFLRKTESLGLYRQQFGRALRPLEGKSHAIIFDHVGNCRRHGLPTQRKQWTLDRRERRSRSEKDPDEIALRTCKNVECFGVYEAYHTACPYCGFVYNPSGRESPEVVDGDLVLLDFSSLDALHKEIARIDRDPNDIQLPVFAGKAACNSVKKRHRERQEAQQALRETMMQWAGKYVTMYPLRERQKLFYLKFGVDVLTAQTLGAREALELKARIEASER